MKTSILALALGLAIPNVAVSYSIYFAGPGSGVPETTYKSLSFLPYYAPSHNDWWGVNWTPGQGENWDPLCGKVGSWEQCVGVTLDPGEGPGVVQLLLSYYTTESLRVGFDNYTPTPYDFHYGFQAGFYDGTTNTQPVINLAPGTNEVLLSFYVETKGGLGLNVDCSDVHDSFSTWKPTVIDPSIPGYAGVDIIAYLTPISLQVVPEPSGLSLCAGALVLMGLSSMKRRR
jgi:hypothetical protein